MQGGPGISMGGGNSSSDQLFNMLKLLSDSSALQAEYTRLDGARKSAQAVIDLVAPASEILTIRGEIDALEQQAQNALDAAKLEATQIVSDAQAQRQKLIDEGNKLHANALDQASKFTEDANAHLATAKQIEDANKSRAVELDNREAALNHRNDELQALESSLNERTAQQAETQAALESIINITHAKVTDLKVV